MARLLTDEELEALAATPRQQFESVLADPAQARATMARLTKAFDNFINGFSTFVAGISAYARDVHGLTAAAEIDVAVFASVRKDLANKPLVNIDADALAEIDRLVTAGDQEAALERYDRYESQVRELHDVAVGRAAAALSQLYRTFGVDELEQCLRFVGDQTLLGWMPHDIARPAQVRIRQWASMMSGNFALITVEESDDAFTITQNPCGTCSRQVLAGAYDQPDGHAVVTERHALTWGRGDVPVYRTHVAVMHDLMPLERIGQRWPEITCPPGVTAGPCTVVLRK